MKHRLDTPRLTLYMAPVVVSLCLLSARPGRAEVGAGGVQLPNGAQKVAENRYRVTQDYEETLKYFRTVYPPEAYPRRAIVNQPGIKAIHIENPTRRRFEGLNIYQADDEVRIYIVGVAAEPKKKEKKDTKGKRR